MLKKMRWHFILAAMLAVFIMLVAVLAGINVWNYHTTAERADQRIQEIYGFESGKVPGMENSEENASQPVPPDIFNRPDDHDPEAPYTTRFFIVRLDEEGNVTDVSTDFIASVTQTEAEEFARKVLNEKRQVGYYKNYRFQILAKKNDNIVIFLNTTMELRSVRNVLLISCLVGVVCFLVVFLLVILLSKRAMKPYIRNIERQKRFITDASHEIKTPLTSIINYADLIGKEVEENTATENGLTTETDSEKEQRLSEYAEVLLRQSRKLKKLLDDLLEASKATTGNLEVHPEVCDVSVLLSQAAGEYEQRFSDKKLETIVKQPEETVKVMADGRHLWRVFDNLLNNIYKYAQAGSRVYLNVEHDGQDVRIIFRNMSAFPLEMSPEELEERFTRGDKSRHMEGNGLGLSIAKSLTELQNGDMQIVTDGDLFKVVITLPETE